MAIKDVIRNEPAIAEFTEIMLALGFTMKTRVQADKGPVCIRLENAILPEGARCEPFYRVKIYAADAGSYVEFSADNIGLVDNSGI